MVCGIAGACFLDEKVSYRSHSCVFAECAYSNDDQIMIPILIPHGGLLLCCSKFVGSEIS